MLVGEGYDFVRQNGIDIDWSALCFRKLEKIKKMVRVFAVERGREEKGRKHYSNYKQSPVSGNNNRIRACFFYLY